MKRLRFATLAVLLAVVAIPLTVYAQQASNYDNFTQVTITNNTGAALTNAVVRIPMNATNLVNGGFLAADGQDILTLDGGGAEALQFAQFDGNGSSWWIPVDSLANGSSETFVIYTGQNTTTADNPQHITLAITSATEDITWTFGSPVITPAVTTVTFDDLLFTAWPSAKMSLGPQQGTSISIDAAGVFTAEIDTSGTDCNLPSGTALQANLALDTSYDISVIYNAGLNPECLLVVNGATTTADNGGNPAATNNGLNQIGGTTGAVFRMNGFTYEEKNQLGDPVQNGTTVTFEPDACSQSQAGASGNLWTWVGTCQDQSAFDEDVTYTFVRSMADIAVTVGHAQSTAAPVSTTSETDPEPFSGDPAAVVVDPFTNPNATTDFGFPFNILAISADAGSVPLQLLALTIVSVGGAIAGFLTFRASRLPGLAILVAAVIAGMLVYLTPMTNIMLVLIAIPAVALVILMPQPFEAR